LLNNRFNIYNVSENKNYSQNFSTALLVNYRLSKVFQFSTKLKPPDPTKLDEENPLVALCRSP